MTRTSESAHASIDGRRVLRWAVLWTLLFESVTLIGRFALGLESTRDTASSIGRLAFGLRIHHGYLGVLLLIVAHTALSKKPSVQSKALILGYALIASDLLHHFCVLWPVFGSPQFDFFYPQSG